MPNIYYRHVRIPNWAKVLHPKHHLDMTFAATVEDDQVRIGIAVCSQDDPFSKEEGRDYSKERVIYCPTFEFPKLHKNNYQAAHSWFKLLHFAIMVDGKPIKDRVARLQRDFDKTTFGIQLKINRNRKFVEKAKAKKKILADKKAKNRQDFLAKSSKV